MMKIEVQNVGNETIVKTNLDPLLSANILLEGVAVLAPQIEAWSQTQPKELNQTAHNMSTEDVKRRIHDYLESALGEYTTTKEIPAPYQP